jgi:serine phosphatase RsbU (regulator of sigma subunit)/putative methionine-R-sulfoxide reductase with GAF domain
MSGPLNPAGQTFLFFQAVSSAVLLFMSELVIPPAALSAIVAAVLVVVVSGLWLLRRRRASRRVLQRQAEELRVLSDATSAIAAASLNEDALCRLVFEHAARLVDVSNFQIGFFEGPRYRIKLRMAGGVAQPETEFDLSETGGIVGWLRDTGRSLLVRDFASEADQLPARPRYISQNPPRSAVFVPLQAGDSVIGAMAIQSPQIGAYTDADLRLLKIVGDQAATAVQNARALEVERDRVRQLELLNDVSRATVSILDTQTLLDRVVALIQRNFGYYFVGIFLRDEVGGFECRAATNPAVIGFRLANGQGLVGSAFRDNAPVVVNDVSTDPRFIALPALPAQRSEAVMPLWTGNRVIGVLDLSSAEPGAYGSFELDYLRILAQQVAVAVENAQLFEQSQQQRKMEQELDFAREIQTSFLPRRTPQVPGWSLAAAWRSARQVGGDFYDFIGPLPDGGWGLVIADVADKGVPAALFMALSRTILRSAGFTGRPPTDVLTRANQMLHADTASDLFVTVCYTHWNPSTGTIRMASAGHNPALLRRANGQIEQLKPAGIALGVIPDAAFQDCVQTLAPGESMLVYTDGVIEALNHANEAFGMPLLIDTFARVGAGDAAEAVDAIIAAVTQHVGDEAPFDDQTLLILKRKETPPGA